MHTIALSRGIPKCQLAKLSDMPAVECGIQSSVGRIGFGASYFGQPVAIVALPDGGRQIFPSAGGIFWCAFEIVHERPDIVA